MYYYQICTLFPGDTGLTVLGKYLTASFGMRIVLLMILGVTERPELTSLVKPEHGVGLMSQLWPSSCLPSSLPAACERLLPAKFSKSSDYGVLCRKWRHFNNGTEIGQYHKIEKKKARSVCVCSLQIILSYTHTGPIPGKPSGKTQKCVCFLVIFLK